MGFIPSSNHTSPRKNLPVIPTFTSSSSSSSSSSSKRKFECPVSALDLKERASTIHNLCFPILSTTNHKAPCRILFHILKQRLCYSIEDIHNKSNELKELVSERLNQSPQGDDARFELVESIVKSETNQRFIIRQRCLSPNDTQFKPIKTIDLTTGEKYVINEELSPNNPQQSIGIKVELNGNGIFSFRDHLKKLATSTKSKIFELGVYKNTEAHSAMILHDENYTFIVDLTTHQGVFSDITDYLEAKNKDFENSENSLILNILPENSFVEPPIKKITKVKSETPSQSEFKILEGNDSNIITKLLYLPENESINELYLGHNVTCFDGTLKQIAQNMNGLQILVLGNNVTCSDDTLKQIAQNMNGLRALYLGNNVTCSNDTLKQIAQNMNGLCNLHLEHNITCSDQTLNLIATKMKELRHLYLGHSVTCSDGTLKQIAQNMNGLRVLYLGNNVTCSDDTLKQIAQNMNGLCNLYLGYKVTCSDDTLKQIAQNMNGLCSLYLGNNVTCSDDTLKQIAQNMNRLEALILGNNVTCSDDTLNLIATKMNGLQILILGNKVICSNQTADQIKPRCLRNVRFYTTPNTTISESSKKLLSS